MPKAPGANCEVCPLRGEAFVPTSGPAKPKYLFVGEAPGFQETIYGRPFVGPSGKLLKQVMKRSGIAASETGFTNTVLCRPPNNDDPSKEAVACCKPRLDREIRERNPSVIFPVGGVASKSVLNNKLGILAARVGPPKVTQDLHGTKIIPSVHPAFVLRSPVNLAFLETDLRKAVLPAVEWRDPNYFVPTSVRTAVRTLNAIRRMGRPVAIDIEVAIDKETDFEHPSQYDLLCLGIAYDEDHAVVIPDELLLDPEVGWAIRDLLSEAPIIAQNGKFDLPGLSSIGDFFLSDDTLLASYALDERSGTHSLDYLGREFIGAPDWKSEISDYKSGADGFAGIPAEKLYRYNAFDCCVTYRLQNVLNDRLQSEGLRGLYEFLVRASNTLMKIEAAGLTVDREMLQKLDREYQNDLQGKELRLAEWVANPRSWQQVQKALAGLGVNTPSTDEEHLKDILDKVEDLIEMSPQAPKQAHDVYAFVNNLLEYRHEQKRYGTYIQGTIKRLYAGRIYPSYLLHGTRTGRLSSRNPNIQNVPRGSEIRGLFIADDEHIFVQADYAQGELRLVTTLAQCKYFHELFNDPTADPIGTTQRELFGVSVNDTAEIIKEKRTRTKNIVYGSLYGMIMGRGKQGKKYAKILGMTNDESYAYQRRFFGLAPEILQWQDETRQRVLDGETLETVFGRKLRIPTEVLILDEKARIDALNECLAFVPQSTLSDICVAAMCELVESGEDIRISIHDALVAHCLVSDKYIVADRLTHAMGNAAKLAIGDYVPFTVEAKAGKNWGELG